MSAGRMPVSRDVKDALLRSLTHVRSEQPNKPRRTVSPGSPAGVGFSSNSFSMKIRDFCGNSNPPPVTLWSS